MNNDTLLHYLTTKGRLTNQEFGDAFQALHDVRRRFSSSEGTLTETADRRAAMRLYGQLGFADFDSLHGVLTVQQPMLLLLPVKPGCGRRMLLTGGRTKTLLDEVKLKAAALGIEVRIDRQHDSNLHLLLPNRVEVRATGSREEGFGLMALKQLAQQCNIAFCENLVQAELLELSVGLEEYKASLKPYNDELPEDWKQSWFNPKTLRWQQGPGNKTFCLTEYELTVYRRQCYLWENGIPYQVDKSWGRYLVLSVANGGDSEQVLLYSKNQNLLAVPAAAPFPELPARAAALLSGFAPKQRIIIYKGQSRRYNVYEVPNVYTLLYNKLPTLLGQQIINFPSL